MSGTKNFINFEATKMLQDRTIKGPLGSQTRWKSTAQWRSTSLRKASWTLKSSTFNDPSSHNHGSVENGPPILVSFHYGWFSLIFHFYDYGRKGITFNYHFQLIFHHLSFQPWYLESSRLGGYSVCTSWENSNSDVFIEKLSHLQLLTKMSYD